MVISPHISSRNVAVEELNPLFNTSISGGTQTSPVCRWFILVIPSGNHLKQQAMGQNHTKPLLFKFEELMAWLDDHKNLGKSRRFLIHRRAFHCSICGMAIKHPPGWWEHVGKTSPAGCSMPRFYVMKIVKWCKMHHFSWLIIIIIIQLATLW